MLRNKHIDSENCQTRRGMRPIYILASVILIFTLLGGGCDNSTKKNLPLDIVKNTFLDVDYNVFPLNPHWGDQENQGPGSLADTITCGPLGGAQDDPKNWKNCTSYPVTIERGNGCGPHVNWRPVTYTGKISWDSHSAPVKDDDYNVIISSDNKGLFGKNRPNGILGEFNSAETIDHFGSKWWTDFHAAVDNSDAHAHSLLDGKDVIVIGLLGLDCAGHDIGMNTCGVELHPIFVLAVHVQDDPNEDAWAFFVRNRGNEGYCSSNNQFLESFNFDPRDDIDTIRIVLPRPTAIKDQIIKSVSIYRRDESLFALNSPHHNPPSVYDEMVLPREGFKLTFHLPNPEKLQRDWVFDAEIHLQWVTQ